MSRPMMRSDLTVVELDGEAVIYDEETGDLHHLNPTATIVFGLCDGRSTMREMSQDISAAFGVAADEVEQQVRALIRRFRGANLLCPPGTGPGDGAGGRG
ncbi:MAG TPA: HPr-rel-A system PqqD family peptide chaperone [Actinomycetota bacterium]|nr:HPr-rel-A system PqqD family peptide chaperone [Actinomycetota bacterium]